MEQSDTNKTEVKTSPQTTEGNFKRFLETIPKEVIVVVILISVAVFYFYVWVPRQECKDSVTYHPTGTVRQDCSGIGGSCLGKRDAMYNQESYYSYSFREFDTESKAISYCVRNKQ